MIQIESKRRKYIGSATGIFSVVMLICFMPMVWPDGIHSLRDVGWFLVLAMMSVGAGLMFSLLTWSAIKAWFQ